MLTTKEFESHAIQSQMNLWKARCETVARVLHAKGIVDLNPAADTPVDILRGGGFESFLKSLACSPRRSNSRRSLKPYLQDVTESTKHRPSTDRYMSSASSSVGSRSHSPSVRYQSRPSNISSAPRNLNTRAGYRDDSPRAYSPTGSESLPLSMTHLPRSNSVRRSTSRPAYHGGTPRSSPRLHYKHCRCSACALVGFPPVSPLSPHLNTRSERI